MNTQSPVMAIIAQESEQKLANQLANSLGYPSADIVLGSPRDAVAALSARSESPRYLIIDIGSRASDVLPEIDAIAEYCEAGTRVVVIGDINDVSFYRDLRSRGIIEYFTRPVEFSQIRAALVLDNAQGNENGGQVLAFMSAASGDGASTIALNTAYALATDYRKSVVLIDMDYQFGMIAKNLDLTTPFGIKELFEHPERGIDSTLIQRMIVGYGNSRMRVIAAPNQLQTVPEIPVEIIHDLITILRRDYDFVILDMPHFWTPWVATALSHSTHAIMVAQLWLRSITHCSRLLNAWRNVGVSEENISLTINRSGAKFKEAVSARDFERISGKPIQYYFVNDIKSVVASENQGKTLIEGGNSVLGRQFKEFSGYFENKKLVGNNSRESEESRVKSGLSGLLKKHT